MIDINNDYWPIDSVEDFLPSNTVLNFHKNFHILYKIHKYVAYWIGSVVQVLLELSFNNLLIHEAQWLSILNSLLT